MANYDTAGLTYDSGVFYDDVFPPQPRKNRMSQISLNLSKLNTAGLLQAANNIKTAMTGNANFTTPNPTLTAIGTLITGLTTANNTYESSVITAGQNLTLRDDAAQALINGLVALQGYVQSVTGGDAAKIQSAGMGVKSARGSSTTPDMVSNLSITSGDNAGELDLQWDTVAGTRTYEVQISPDPMTATSFTSQPSVTKSKAIITGLTSGTRAWVRVRAVNAAGQGAWSDVGTKIAP